jgi:hypothetical protein
MTVQGTPSGSSSLIDNVIAMVKDSSGKLINPADFAAAISTALRTYSKHRPDQAVVDIQGNGTNDYDLPEGWVEGFSEILSVEYPLDQVPEYFLENDEYKIYQTPTGKKVRLLYEKLDASKTFRMTFSVPRTEETVLPNDIEAVADLATSVALGVLANIFLQTSDPTIGADVVNYRSKSQEATSRAKQHAADYGKHMGIKDTDVTPAASAVTSFEEDYPGGIGRLTHPRWARRKR